MQKHNKEKKKDIRTKELELVDTHVYSGFDLTLPLSQGRKKKIKQRLVRVESVGFFSLCYVK